MLKSTVLVLVAQSVVVLLSLLSVLLPVVKVSVENEVHKIYLFDPKNAEDLNRKAGWDHWFENWSAVMFATNVVAVYTAIYPTRKMTTYDVIFSVVSLVVSTLSATIAGPWIAHSLHVSGESLAAETVLGSGSYMRMACPMFALLPKLITLGLF